MLLLWICPTPWILSYTSLTEYYKKLLLSVSNRRSKWLISWNRKKNQVYTVKVFKIYKHNCPYGYFWRKKTKSKLLTWTCDINILAPAKCWNWGYYRRTLLLRWKTDLLPLKVRTYISTKQQLQSKVLYLLSHWACWHPMERCSPRSGSCGLSSNHRPCHYSVVPLQIRRRARRREGPPYLSPSRTPIVSPSRLAEEVPQGTVVLRAVNTKNERADCIYQEESSFKSAPS